MPREQRIGPRRAVCEWLETRRLLADFNAGGGDDTVTVSSFGTFIQVFWSGVGSTFYENPGTLNINLLGGQDTLNITGTSSFAVNININMGTGDDVIHFSPTNKRLDQIGGNCTLAGGTGSDSVVAWDDNDGVAIYSVTSARFDRPGWGGFFYAADIEALTLRTSIGSDTVNVTSTFASQPVTVTNPNGADIVNVGNASQGVQGIVADLTVRGEAGTNTVNINDAADAVARSANFDWHNISAFGRVNNLAPAKIIWETANTTMVNVTTGINGDTLLVYSNTVPFTLNNAGSIDSVIIGADIVAGMTYIWAPINVENDPSFTNLTLNNNEDYANHNWTVDIASGHGSITGLALGTVSWDNADINAIFLQCGGGVDTGLVKRLSESLVITNVHGGNIDQITFGDPSAGGMQGITPGINSNIVVQNDPGYTDIILDDTGDPTPRTVNLDVISGDNELSGLAPATFRIDDNDVRNLTIRTGSGADTVNVTRAGTVSPGKLTVTSSGGADLVTLGANVVGILEIVGNVDVTNPAGQTTLVINNRQDIQSCNVTQIFASPFIQMSGLFFSGILRYPPGDVASVEFQGDSVGGDIYSIGSTAAGKPFRLETGLGGDTLFVGGDAVVDLIETNILDPLVAIQGNARIRLAGASANQKLVTNVLDISGNGTLDISTKAVIINYSPGNSPLNAICAAVNSGYAGGTWTGTGIVTTAIAGRGVGFGEASSIFSSFPVNYLGSNIDNTTILIRHTLYGDADLDRDVDVNDLNFLAANFKQTGRVFTQGNFNYSADGLVDEIDLGLLSLNWQQTLSLPFAPEVVATGPIKSPIPRRLTPRAIEQVTEL